MASATVVIAMSMTVDGLPSTVPTPGGIPADYKLVQSLAYPDGKSYSGPAERCYATFTFLPSNWPGANWFINSLIVKRIAEKLSASGARPLTLKLYEKGFDYIMVIEAAKPSVGSAVGFIQIGWSVLLLAAFVLAALIVVFFTVKSVEEFFYKAPAAATTAGLIALGLAGMFVVGLAISKGTSVKGAITGR